MFNDRYPSLNINYFHIIVISAFYFYSIRSVILQIQRKFHQKKGLSILTLPCCATLQRFHPLTTLQQILEWHCVVRSFQKVIRYSLLKRIFFLMYKLLSFFVRFVGNFNAKNIGAFLKWLFYSFIGLKAQLEI